MIAPIYIINLQSRQRKNASPFVWRCAFLYSESPSLAPNCRRFCRELPSFIPRQDCFTNTKQHNIKHRAYGSGLIMGRSGRGTSFIIQLGYPFFKVLGKGCGESPSFKKGFPAKNLKGVWGKLFSKSFPHKKIPRRVSPRKNLKMGFPRKAVFYK